MPDGDDAAGGPGRGFLRVSEVSQATGLSRHRVKSAIRCGTLRAIDLGDGKILVAPESVNTLLRTLQNARAAS